MLDSSHKSLSNAILQTAAYADVFDHPLTAQEIYLYLTGLQVSFETLNQALNNETVLVQTGEHFTLPGREEIIRVRIQRKAHSRRLLPRAMRYGRILGSLPFVRMVALTGSLAVMNVSKTDDIDYMLVTVPGRVWTARAFALLFNRVVKFFGHTICPNLIVSENALEWPLHDLYSARELCQMIPISGMGVYQKLMQANAWARDFLPNAFDVLGGGPLLRQHNGRRLSWSAPLEHFLRGRLGDRFEEWEMERKIARFSRQEGFGEETVFNTQVCQGNFHHHRKWTQEVFERRLSTLAAIHGRDLNKTQSPSSATGAYMP